MMKKKVKLGVLLLAILLVLTACTSSDDFESKTPSDTLVVATSAEPVTFDIHATNDTATTSVARQIYQTLIRQTEDMELVSELATEWKAISDDTYEFKLREDVTFHNGEKFTSADVVWTLKRAAEKPQVAAIVGVIDPDKVVAIDEYTVQIGTKEPFGPLLTHLAHPAAAIMNEKAVTEGGADYGKTIAVGTGPYKLTEWLFGSAVKLEQFADYWGEAAKLPKIEFKIVKEASVRLIDLETGNVDIAYGIAPADVAKLRDNPGLQLVRGVNLSSAYIGINVTKDKPTNDVRVRQALAYAMDLPSIIETIYQGIGTQMTGPINELIFGYNPDLEPYEYNLDKAKELMAEAGYPNGGFSLEFYVGNNNQERVLVAQVFKEQAAKLGIEVNITQLDWTAFLDAALKGQPDVFVLGWTTVTGDGDYGLYPLFHSSAHGPSNRTFYTNARVDELVELARKENDQDKRLEYYKEVQAIVHDEVPWIFMQTGENLNGLTKYVQGFKDHPTGTYFLSGVSK